MRRAKDTVWEEQARDAAWQGLGKLEADLETDLCVVGLGGSGLSAVSRGLELGQRVVGLDARSVAGGAAGRNGGFLLAGTAAFYHDAVSKLGRERAKALYDLTLSELDRMNEETPDAIRRTGSLRITTSPEEEMDCEAQLNAMRADALPVEPYEGREGKGLLIPTDGVFNPLKRCRTLARKALAEGAILFERLPALSISSGRVTTPNGSVNSEHIVVAVDGGLEQLLPQLKPRVRTARLQMLATAPTTRLSLPRPVYARYGYEYWQQLPDGSLALGGFRDKGGEAEWTIDKTPTPLVQRHLEHFLREHIGVNAPVTHRWAASVGYTPGILPLFEEVADNVWAVGGYNGTGNVMGALCGRGAVEKALTGHAAVADLLAA